MILRRYLPADAGIKTLADLRFRIGRIHEANDPSEFLANYTLQGSALPPSWSEFLTGMVKDTHVAKIGRLCFSAQSVSDQLMWGHYADGCRGVCIEVESDALEFGPDVLFPVNYKTPPSIEATLFHNPNPESQTLLKSQMMEVLKTKAHIWNYEKEQRAFVQLRGELSAMDPVTKEVSFFFSINPKAIRAVYIGAAAFTKTAVSVSDCLRYHQLKAELKKMVLHASTGEMIAESFD